MGLFSFKKKKKVSTKESASTAPPTVQPQQSQPLSNSTVISSVAHVPSTANSSPPSNLLPSPKQYVPLQEFLAKIDYTEEYVLRLMSKNFSNKEEDRLTPQEIQFLTEMHDSIEPNDWKRLRKVAKKGIITIPYVVEESKPMLLEDTISLKEQIILLKKELEIRNEKYEQLEASVKRQVSELKKRYSRVLAKEEMFRESVKQQTEKCKTNVKIIKLDWQEMKQDINDQLQSFKYEIEKNMERVVETVNNYCHLFDGIERQQQQQQQLLTPKLKQSVRTMYLNQEMKSIQDIETKLLNNFLQQSTVFSPHLEVKSTTVQLTIPSQQEKEQLLHVYSIVSVPSLQQSMLKNCVRMIDDHCIEIDTQQASTTMYIPRNQSTFRNVTKKTTPQQYFFDQIYVNEEHSLHDKLWEDVQWIPSALLFESKKMCFFVYQNEQSNALFGLYIRLIEQLFDETRNKNCRISFSLTQINGPFIKDCLQQDASATRKNINAEQVTKVTITNVGELQYKLHRLWNQTTSHQHVICTLYIQVQDSSSHWQLVESSLTMILLPSVNWKEEVTMTRIVSNQIHTLLEIVHGLYQDKKQALPWRHSNLTLFLQPLLQAQTHTFFYVQIHSNNFVKAYDALQFANKIINF